MNFGDILEQWDSIQKTSSKADKIRQPQVSHKKANAPSKEEKMLLENQRKEKTSQPSINPIELWLRRYGTTDKDKLSAESEEAGRMKDREYLRTMKPEARIDLHGLTRDEAWTRLEDFVNMCVSRNFKKIEIVHGKGIHSHGSDPVLGQMVKTFIERNEHLGTSGHPDRNHGGSGATWVLIK